MLRCPSSIIFPRRDCALSLYPNDLDLVEVHVPITPLEESFVEPFLLLHAVVLPVTSKHPNVLLIFSILSTCHQSFSSNLSEVKLFNF